MTDMKFKGFNAIFALMLLIAAFGTACQKDASNKPVANGNSNGASNSPAATATPADSKTPSMTDYPVGGAKSPSEAYRMLFAAVKSQDTAKIKLMLSQASIGLGEMAAGQQKKPIEEVLKNGFTETTFADTMPQLRDQRIKGGYGAVEVWNTTRKQWDDIPFILEGGVWKAAFGDAFGGKWQSPGKSQTVLEQEAANAKNPNLIPAAPQRGNVNTNSAVNKMRPQKPKPE